METKKLTVNDYKKLEMKLKVALKENLRLQKQLVLQGKELKMKKNKLYSAERNLDMARYENMQLKEDLQIAEQALEKIFGD